MDDLGMVMGRGGQATAEALVADIRALEVGPSAAGKNRTGMAGSFNRDREQTILINSAKTPANESGRV